MLIEADCDMLADVHSIQQRDDWLKDCVPRSLFRITKLCHFYSSKLLFLLSVYSCVSCVYA